MAHPALRIAAASITLLFAFALRAQTGSSATVGTTTGLVSSISTSTVPPPSLTTPVTPIDPSINVAPSDSGAPVTLPPVTARATTPPVLFGISGGGSVELGQKVTLQVSLSGAVTDPELTYQWRRNGTDLSAATAATYVLEAVNPADSATYTVAVTNSAGTSVATTDVTVKPAAAPVITTQPRTSTASVGQTITFTLVATGSFPRTYQWRKDGANLAAGTEATLTLTSITTATAGVYTVVVTNALGSTTSTAASLTVNAATPPVISSNYPFDVTAAQGASATLSTSFSSGSSPFTYQWLKSGAPIAGATGSQLLFNPVALTDAGKYSVVVTNAAGTATSREATLTVTAAIPISITFPPRAIAVFPGQSASFSVSYNGSSPLTFQWLKNGAPIAGATSSSFSISSVTLTDAGNFSVVLTNIAGPVTSSSALLTVNQPVAPTITTQPVDATTTEGSSTSFFVSATGSPPMTYQWHLNGVALPNANSSSYSLSAGSLIAGKYRVTVTNAAGTATSVEATLTVLPPPAPPVYSLNNTSVSLGNSLSFSISSSGANVPTTYQWYRNGKAIAQATQASLSVSAAKVEDAGAYFVVVTNSGGSTTSRTAQVAVTAPSATATGAWFAAERQGDIAYFAFSNPSRIERFNLAADAWLPVIALNRTPTAMAATDNALYVAFGATLSRFALDGSGETTFTSGFTANVTGLIVCNGFLIVAQGTSQITSVRLSDGAKIGSASSSYYWAPQMSVAPASGRIFSHSSGISPSDITVLTMQPGGTLSSVTDSPYHGDYITGTRSFVFPNQTYVVDDGGTIYFVSNLTFAGGLGGKFDDLAFTSAGDPVVLRSGAIYVYDAKFNETGRFETGTTGVRVFVRGNDVYIFGHPPAGGSIVKSRFALSQAQTPAVAAVVDPAGLGFTPDATFLDKDGTVLLYSKIHRQLFRWSTTQRRFLPSIPLQGWPDFVTYSATTHRVYFGYGDRRITQLQLDSAAPTEQPFASAPEQILGLITVGQYVFLCDPTGAWVSYYIFAPDGRLVTRREWSYYGASYVWSPANRRVYQFRDDTSPNDLLYTEVNADGTLGAQKDSPYHGEISTRYPIRISPDGGTILLGSGKFFDANTLSQNNSLPTSIDDAAWVNNRVVTARATSDGIEVQRWGGNNYALDRSALLTGRLVHFAALPGDRLLAVTVRDGLVYFTTYDQNLAVLATDFGGLPNRLANISTRALVGRGDDILIPGFFVTGSQPKTLLVRAAGPALAAYGVSGALADPVLTIFNSSGVAIAGNDNWSNATNLAALNTVVTRVGAFPFAKDSRDAATLLNLDPGAYTVQVKGANDTTGVALVEVYDAQDNNGDGRLINLAARAQVGTSGDVLITGIVVQGEKPKTILVRAVGPTLATFGVTGALANPRLRLFRGEQLLRENDDWGDGDSATRTQITQAAASVGAFGLPAGSRDATLLITLPPGTYSAQVSGADASTGVALVEVYEVTNP